MIAKDREIQVVLWIPSPKMSKPSFDESKGKHWWILCARESDVTWQARNPVSIKKKETAHQSHTQWRHSFITLTSIHSLIIFPLFKISCASFFSDVSDDITFAIQLPNESYAFYCFWMCSEILARRDVQGEIKPIFDERIECVRSRKNRITLSPSVLFRNALLERSIPHWIRTAISFWTSRAFCSCTSKDFLQLRRRIVDSRFF